MLALLVAVLFSAEPCTTNADCEVISPCCSCCPQPQAVTKQHAKEKKERCAVSECSMQCPDVACDELVKPASAVCKAKQCVLEPLVTKLSPGVCTTDADCTIAQDCTCECCPAKPAAMTKSQAMALRQKCSRLGPCGRDPKECAAVKCANESAASFNAVCRENACVRVAK